jgi:thiaminase
LPFKSLIPEKFTRYLLNDKVYLRSRLQTISAAREQITITVCHFEINMKRKGKKSQLEKFIGNV